MSYKVLPPGYTIIDTNHDGDAEDGRFGLYDPNEEFLGNLDDRQRVIELAWEHANEAL